MTRAVLFETMLHQIALHCNAFDGAIWSWVVLYGIAWHLIVLHCVFPCGVHCVVPARIESGCLRLLCMTSHASGLSALRRIVSIALHCYTLFRFILWCFALCRVALICTQRH